MAQYTEFLYKVVNETFGGDYTQLYGGIEIGIPIEEDIKKKLYAHYRNFEIGFETVDYFLYEFLVKYNELVPKIKMYYEALMNEKFKILSNDTRSRIYKLVRDANNTSSVESSSVSNYKDTPYTAYVQSSETNYVYNTTVTDGSSDSINESEIKQEDNYDETMSGLVGITPAEAIKRYMDIWFDIELMVIKEFRELFMEVY